VQANIILFDFLMGSTARVSISIAAREGDDWRKTLKVTESTMAARQIVERGR